VYCFFLLSRKVIQYLLLTQVFIMSFVADYRYAIEELYMFLEVDFLEEIKKLDKFYVVMILQWSQILVIVGIMLEKFQPWKVEQLDFFMLEILEVGSK